MTKEEFEQINVGDSLRLAKDRFVVVATSRKTLVVENCYGERYLMSYKRRRHMFNKLALGLALALAMLFLLALVAKGEELPDAPSAHAVSTVTYTAAERPKRKETREQVISYWSFVGAYATTVALDTHTTIAFQNHPCGCMHEMNPLAINTKNAAANIAFQASIGAAVIGTSYYFRKHGHPTFAKVMLGGITLGEMAAVQNNYEIIDRANQDMKRLK